MRKSHFIHQYRYQTGRRQSSIREKKAYRELLQGRTRGDKEKSVYSSISKPNRTEAELHKKKEDAEGIAAREDKWG